MSRFPGEKRFAFSVFDDTDDSTCENVGPVYRFLHELDIHTTKSVWALANTPDGEHPGSTLQDAEYLAWVLELQERGFEIALHNIRNGSSTREIVEQGLAQFSRLLGKIPRCHTNHTSNRENMYWGDARLSGVPQRLLYNLATRFRAHRYFEGHVPGSRYFWGDLCRQHVDYVRNFNFSEINLDRVTPLMPYHDSSRPYVNYWFSSSEAAHVEDYCHLLSEANQDRLEEEGGVCILYTHFACGFSNSGKLHPRFEQLTRRLAKKNGWFVPVSTLLDHLRVQHGNCTASRGQLIAMEKRWLLHKLRHGAS